MVTIPALTVGERVGPYEILGVIGVGGMGEVYRARDPKLKRDVAIKVLPATVAGNPRRLLRFEREAQALAALNHPNIAAVYGIEEPAVGATGGRALVMELVEGEDLSWRLRRGRLPLVDALEIARQVADALSAAHEAGIVHRDLKPANIRVRNDGTVKVLDFGLAQNERDEADGGSDSRLTGSSGSGTNSQDVGVTLTLALGVTGDGSVVGTAAYMAPEQAKGKAVDKRADIWAFGIVLFEMLAGHRPFTAEDAADAVARALAAEPDWHLLPADTPGPVRRLLARCLVKDRRKRLRDIADAHLEIDDALAQGPAVEPDENHASARGRQIGTWTALALAGAALGLIAGAAAFRSPAETGGVTYASVSVTPAEALNGGGANPTVVLPPGGARTALAWAPDGRTLAFIGERAGVRRVYVRDLATDAARELAGTEGAGSLTFSPTGEDIAFWAGDSLYRISRHGGLPLRICHSAIVQGISWGRDLIVVADSGPLFSVAPAGGAPVALLPDQHLVRTSTPFLLPDGTAVLYTEHSKQWTSGDERIMALPLQRGAEPVRILNDAADPRYLATGHLAFLRQGTMFVVPFDPKTLEVKGEPWPVVKDVAQAIVAWDSDDLTLAGQVAVSPRGTLAVAHAPRPNYPDRELVAVDRSGRVSPLGAPPGGYRSHIAVAPDGRRIALSVQSTSAIRLHTFDLQRGALSILGDVIKGEANAVSWAAGDRIAVEVINDGRIAAALVSPDVASQPQMIPDTDRFWASSVSNAGLVAGMKDGDVWVYAPLVPGSRPVSLPTTAVSETQPTWSPDGRWLAYTSTASGRSEVYVRPYPGPGEATIVSLNGGSAPRWSPAGRELFYLEDGQADARMMTVDVDNPSQPGRPRLLFSADRALFSGTAILTPYDVSPDGQRFYAVRTLPRDPHPITQIDIVLNWFETLKAGASRP